MGWADILYEVKGFLFNFFLMFFNNNNKIFFFFFFNGTQLFLITFFTAVIKLLNRIRILN